MTARLPINLMLVEDERIVAFDLQRQLHGFGYRVGAVVASGEQAVRKAAEEKPDLVLMDIHLEGRMDGIEAASEIRARHQIPVVFLTAYAEDDTLRRALDSRPFGYLVKPCEGRELHATIQMALARREDEAAVEQSEQRLKLAIDAAELGVLEWSPESRRLKGDGHLHALFGTRPLPLDEPWDAFIARVAVADRARVEAALAATQAGSEAVCVEFSTVDNHLPTRYMEAHAKAYTSAGDGTRVVGILQDVTQRHRDEERLRQSSVVFHTTAEAIVITDMRRCAVAVNSAFSRITGFAEEEAIGRDPDALLRLMPCPERDAACLDADGAGFWSGEVACHRKGGEPFPAWQNVSVVRNAAGRATHLVTTFSDVSAIYEAHRQLRHLAHHDPLTGLPNRTLFDDRLATAIENALRHDERCLLLFLDLDGFKVINDTLGHAVGDELLRAIGGRLRSVMRASDTIARLGGDEFVILAGSVHPDYAAQLADKILAVLRDPIEVRGETLAVTGSIGIAVFPDNGTDSQQLMRAADMAMYTAKSEGRNRYHFYAEDMAARARERMRIEQGLRRAIAADALAVHYQPRVELAGGRIAGVEALVRWPHPERGMILPGSFIAIAEESGIIEALGRWVLRRACREMLRLQTPLRLAVNVSARQFLAVDFVDHVAATLAETGFLADMLELEITESTLQATERSLGVIEDLGRLGVAVSIDDFGTGYSSLAVLRDLPIRRIKVDRSFIVDLAQSEQQRAVVEAVVALSRALRMSITVEGIERDEQAAILKQLGCDEGQGFLFARPMPFDELSRRIADGQWRGLPGKMPS
ncbi:EAL domain-containing protein [Azospira restricta]|uniref:EAL domain-containing protein n=1 Tax=Azospira restricta TaxID=404405 RepID=A0A974SQT7_9RHOO|nr:EAL domain-containing protein [Azospira restricta]QRJ64727.1 EAL domain-containing protein [Azospira restricta]